MSFGKSKILPLSALVLLTGLTFATSAQAEWRHGPIRRDERARFNNHVFVRHPDWRFERGRGGRVGAKGLRPLELQRRQRRFIRKRDVTSGSKTSIGEHGRQTGDRFAGRVPRSSQWSSRAGPD